MAARRIRKNLADMTPEERESNRAFWREYYRQHREKRRVADNNSRKRRRAESHDDPEYFARGFISSARNRAKRKGLPIEIDKAWFLAQWDAQGGCCAVTGVKLERSRSADANRADMWNSPSIDRIDPTKG